MFKGCVTSVIQAFGHEPKWILLDDDIPKKMPDYKNSPFLYIFTSTFRWGSSIRRGDNGKRISPIMLPVSSEIKDDIYGWERVYRHYDHIWLDSGVLEIPVYKQLADPKSELSDRGRKICADVEKATGIPTYYYLMRYWGRKNGEDQRKCPACGNQWHIEAKETKKEQFWHFHFQCHECRLVSHKASCCYDERHARIGEYKNS
jgi:predicted  nucleic acid-binding Zn ribbon protein